MLPKQRIDIPLDEQIKFANKLRAIDKKSGILDYLPGILYSDSSSESSESEIDVHVDIHWQFLCNLVMDERVGRKFCRNTHSLMLKMNQLLF